MELRSFCVSAYISKSWFKQGQYGMNATLTQVVLMLAHRLRRSPNIKINMG